MAFTAWVYRPLLGAWFWADDFTNMASVANDGVLRFAFRPFGGHNLLARNLVFAASFSLFGLDAEPWFWTVLLTHLLNVWLLFRLVRALTGSVTLACLGATPWGTSPLVAASLAWYSVFGQVMLATIVLVVLGQLATLARSGDPLPPARPSRGTRSSSSGRPASASGWVQRWFFRSPSSSCSPRPGAGPECAPPTSRCPS